MRLCGSGGGCTVWIMPQRPANDRPNLLREAASAMREDHGPLHPRARMWGAMAMLLRAHAVVREAGHLYDAATERTADLVAETYLESRG